MKFAGPRNIITEWAGNSEDPQIRGKRAAKSNSTQNPSE